LYHKKSGSAVQGDTVLPEIYYGITAAKRFSLFHIFPMVSV